MKYIIIFFIVALAIRLTAWQILQPNMDKLRTDGYEYYTTSLNLEPLDYYKGIYGQDFKWYQHSAIHTYFLHITNQSIPIQILLSVIGCLLLFRLNNTVGWLWAIYPQSIIFSFQYGKETMFLLFVIIAIYLLRNHKWWLLGAIPFVQALFTGNYELGVYNHQFSLGFMKNVWELWKPSFGVSQVYSDWFVYAQAIPYLLLMWHFIKRVNLWSPEIMLICFFTVSYALVFATERYREGLMPLIFLKAFEKTNKI